MSLRAAGCVLAVLGMLLVVGARAQESGPAEPATEPPPELRYEVVFEGVEDPKLLLLLQQVSDSRRLLDRPPNSRVRLRRRAEDDQPNFVRVLRSEGYYGAEIAAEIDWDVVPIRVVFAIDPGAVYRLERVIVDVAPPPPETRGETPERPDPAALGVASGDPAIAQTILDAEAALLRRIREQGFALARLEPRRAVVDHDTTTMDLTLAVLPGPLTRFGVTRIEGASEVDAEFAIGRLPWRPGDTVTPELLAEGRKVLLDTRLFSTVQIRLGGNADARGWVRTTVEVNERKHRSIGVGVGFRTDEGPGGNVSWEHRNVFGRNQQVEIELEGTGIAAFLRASYRRPDFWRRDQALIARTELAYEDPDGFESQSLGASLGLERRLGERKQVDASVAYRAAAVKDKEDDDRDVFGLISLPMNFLWDRSDDLLDPSEGGRLKISNQPFTDTLGESLVFNRTRVSYAHYLQLLEQPGLVLAGRTAVGTLFGASRESVPADERFYAGGGGSVRGFGYQLAGPLDDKEKPFGGRSLFEMSLELRARATETLGGVVFVDSGSVFEASLPDFDQDLRTGAGAGLRYFSPIGPLRLDVGVPINSRSSDDAFQIYVSVGQAF